MTQALLTPKSAPVMLCRFDIISALPYHNDDLLDVRQQPLGTRDEPILVNPLSESETIGALDSLDSKPDLVLEVAKTITASSGVFHP